MHSHWACNFFNLIQPLYFFAFEFDAINIIFIPALFSVFNFYCISKQYRYYVNFYCIFNIIHECYTFIAFAELRMHCALHVCNEKSKVDQRNK